MLTRPLEYSTEENIEGNIPSTCTTAKPRTGPDPKTKRAKPAIKVVTFESKMVAQAFSYPTAIAKFGFDPDLISSLILSLIKTFESIAIPRVKAMAAIPGRVKVACNKDSSATSRVMFRLSATAENNPNTR